MMSLWPPKEMEAVALQKSGSSWCDAVKPCKKSRVLSALVNLVELLQVVGRHVQIL